MKKIKVNPLSSKRAIAIIDLAYAKLKESEEGSNEYQVYFNSLVKSIEVAMKRNDDSLEKMNKEILSLVDSSLIEVYPHFNGELDKAD